MQPDDIAVRGAVEPATAVQMPAARWAPPRTPMLLVGAAVTWEGLEVGPMFRRKGYLAWDAAFVHYVGRRSHYGHQRTSWPLHAPESAEQLAHEAREREWMADEPIPGDVYLLWSPSRRAFVHTGIVVDVLGLRKPIGEHDAHVCEVIEGNTSVNNPLQGNLVLRRQRHFTAADRFVRWCGMRSSLWRLEGRVVQVRKAA